MKWTAALALAVMATPGWAAVPTLSLPMGAELTVDITEPAGSYAVPLGPWTETDFPRRTIHGPVLRRVWRVREPGISTAALMRALEPALTTAGYRTGFSCETITCGGFDFRYETPVVPEPEMHVDLGDFRFLAAEGPGGYVTLFISRSSDSGFVQMIHVGPAAAATAPVVEERVAPSDPTAAEPAPDATDIAARLTAGHGVVLDDLRFASGAAALEVGPFGTLDQLADWLKAEPARKITLVGHTDNSGTLDGNITLSRRRAESVRAYLIRAGVPADRVGAEGAGWLAPRDTNATDTGRARNRRVEAVPG